MADKNPQKNPDAAHQTPQGGHGETNSHNTQSTDPNDKGKHGEPTEQDQDELEDEQLDQDNGENPA